MKKQNCIILALLFFDVCLLSVTIDFAPHLVFHRTESTLNRIMDVISKREKGVYLRFGDGDVNLANKKNDMFQKASNNLALEMREALSIKGKNVVKALPLCCKELGGYENGMFPGNHESNLPICRNLLNKAKLFWGDEIRDVYSPVALHFAATNYKCLCINFLKFLKRNNTFLLVGNENIPCRVRKVLFGENCKFVPTPSKNSYDAIDRIEEECLKKIANDSSYKIIVTAMGCSGRILQKRLWNKLDNVFLFDFGSLMDALCDWNTRAWIRLTKFDGNEILNLLKSEIRVVYTAALIENKFHERKLEYIDSLNVILDFGYEPYIIEACTNGPSFLENYSKNVFYSNINNSRLRNKGVNEARSLIEGFRHFTFADDDMIVKLTGRYRLENDSFLKLVEDNPDVDAFVKTDRYGQVWTGCFALRYKLFKDMLSKFDFEMMERYMINIEREVAGYIKEIKKEGHKILYLDKLNVVANIFGNGDNFPNNVSHW